MQSLLEGIISLVSSELGDIQCSHHLRASPVPSGQVHFACMHSHTSHHAGAVCWSSFCGLTPSCFCLLRFDYCRFIELDYVPMESGYMVSMRPTKGYASTKSPTKGYTSTKSPDRRSTNSPSTPRSRSVKSPRLNAFWSSWAWECIWCFTMSYSRKQKRSCALTS